jgi:hypothetical protein
MRIAPCLMFLFKGGEWDRRRPGLGSSRHPNPLTSFAGCLTSNVEEIAH